MEESVEQCTTEEDMLGDPAKFLSEQAGMEGCSITLDDRSDGKIRMLMECTIEGAAATAESNGTYSADRYELITTMKIKIADTTIEMESFVRGERIGDC